MSDPRQTCGLCGHIVHVVADGRGFPPDIAKRKLVKWCKANGCPSQPVYRAGIRIGGPIQGMTGDYLDDGIDWAEVSWRDREMVEDRALDEALRKRPTD